MVEHDRRLPDAAAGEVGAHGAAQRDGRPDGRARVLRAGPRAPRHHHDNAAGRYWPVPRRDDHQRRPARRRPVLDPGCGPSHGQFDHAGGLAGLAGTQGPGRYRWWFTR